MTNPNKTLEAAANAFLYALVGAGTVEEAANIWTKNPEARQQAHAYLESLPLPLVEGEGTGWKFVPIEPTEAMWGAGMKFSNRVDIWTAMLAAAPSPTSLQKTQGSEVAGRSGWRDVYEIVSRLRLVESDRYRRLALDAAMMIEHLFAVPASPPDTDSIRNGVIEALEAGEAWTRAAIEGAGISTQDEAKARADAEAIAAALRSLRSGRVAP